MSEGIIAKTKRLVKSFFEGATKSAPMTLLYSTAAFGASAAMAAATGIDPLNVSAATTTMLVTRVMGSMFIGAGVGGGMNLLAEFSKPDALVAAADTPLKTRNLGGKSPAKDHGVDHVMVPPTPNSRDSQRVRV